MISLFRIFTTTAVLPLCFSTLSSNAFSSQPTLAAGIQLDELLQAGYRIDWMNRSNATGLHQPTIIHESLYTIDGEDYLTRYDLHSGKWLWSTPVGNQVFELRSITEFSDEDRVYVTSDGALYVLEKTTGNFPTRSSENGSSYAGQKQILPLKWIANTPAITTDNKTIIYGSSKGDAIWFNPAIGFDVHRYHVGSSIHVQPTFASGKRNKDGLQRRIIIVSSNNGDVVAIDLNQIKKLWALKLTSPVESEPTYGTNTQVIDDEGYERTSVFIAGTDQYLRSVDLHTGKLRWVVLTSSKLTDSPVFVRNRVYQHIPNSGLASFNAFPIDLTGEQLWLAEDVMGNVITTSKTGQLVCWDKANALLQIVDSRMGGVVSTLSIPHAKAVLADNPSNGSLYVLTHDNVLLRLVSRH